MSSKSKEIRDASFLYCTNRNRFMNEIESGNIHYLHKVYLDDLFIGVDCRPKYAEIVAILIVGGEPLEGKMSFDGYRDDNRTPLEAKCTCGTSLKKLTASITINDPSQKIYDNYDNTNPIFVFPYFVDGHLLVVFEVSWQHLKPLFVDGLNNILKKNKEGKQSRNFTLSPTKWIDNASIVFLNSSYNQLNYNHLLPRVIQSKIKEYSLIYQE